MTLVTLVLTGLVYPLAVTGARPGPVPAPGQRQPRSSADGRVVGSELIGQAFASPGYFQPRPSAAGAAATTPRPPPARTWARRRRSCATASPADVERLRTENPQAPGPGAPRAGDRLRQRPRPARQPGGRALAGRRGWRRRAGWTPPRSQALVEARVEARTLGFLGEPRVNVLLLNLDLDRALRRAQGAIAQQRAEVPRACSTRGGSMAAILLGVPLVPLREVTTASNLAFVFLALTIVVGELGGRWPGVPPRSARAEPRLLPDPAVPALHRRQTRRHRLRGLTGAA